MIVEELDDSDVFASADTAVAPIETARIDNARNFFISLSLIIIFLGV
jgi:hypothetical protein